MKKILFMIISVFFSTIIFSRENVKNLIVIPDSKNLSSGEKAWLPASICDKLESNFQTYTNYEMVSSKEEAIKNYQKKSETLGFDEAMAIELGKLVSASHAIYLTVVKADGAYSVTAEVVNLTTGKSIAKKMVSGKKKAEELFSIAGCAADEITITLLEQLGVSLTNTQKYILKYGSMNISDSEKLVMFNQEIENYNKQITALNKEIAQLSKTVDLSASAKKAKLEAEKALAEEKLKVTQVNKIRLADIEKAKVEELENIAARTVVQQKRILDVSKEVNEKVAKLRKLKMDVQSSFGMLRVIEAKKAALLEIRENVKNEQDAIEEKCRKEYETKINAVNNAPWRLAECTSFGEPTASAKQSREAKVNSLYAECDRKIKTERERIENITKTSQDEIYAEILSDYKTLEDKTFYVNTLNENLRITIGNYDGNKMGWGVEYSVLRDGVELYSGWAEINYGSLEMLKPSNMELFDAVDMYDSLFKCNEPVLTFEVSYKIKPVRDSVSTYEYNFSELRVFDTSTIKNTESQALSGSNFICGRSSKTSEKVSPGYNIRTESEEKKVQNKEKKAQDRYEIENSLRYSLPSFHLGWEGSFSGAYSIISNYGTRWLLGGDGKFVLNGVTRRGWGFGGLVEINYLHNIRKKLDLNFMWGSVRFLLEKHIPIRTIVFRPQGTIGFGFAGRWGEKNMFGILLITTFGCYFDCYISEIVAFYFGSTIKASLVPYSYEEEAKDKTSGNDLGLTGTFQPVFSIGVKCVKYKN